VHGCDAASKQHHRDCCRLDREENVPEPAREETDRVLRIDELGGGRPGSRSPQDGRSIARHGLCGQDPGNTQVQAYRFGRQTGQSGDVSKMANWAGCRRTRRIDVPQRRARGDEHYRNDRGGKSGRVKPMNLFKTFCHPGKSADDSSAPRNVAQRCPSQETNFLRRFRNDMVGSARH
jgi:hypothetical protein